MFGTDAGSFFGQDFGIGIQKAAQKLNVFIINVAQVIHAKMALLVFF